VADGVSVISSYRSQFNSIIRTSSFAQLLERLRSREANVSRGPDPSASPPRTARERSRPAFSGAHE
jgi:hypothetical protein